MTKDDRWQQLHRIYCEETGRHIPWTHARAYPWAALAVETDKMAPMDQAIRLVAARIKRLAKDFRGWEHHLNFQKFTDPGVFCDHLSAALAEGRHKPLPRGLREVLGATGRSTEPPTQEPKKVDEIMATDAFKELMKLRDNL